MDWDAFSGTCELVFDAPIWGSRDREYDRLQAWHDRARKRGGDSWAALAEDFPLYPGWEGLFGYVGVPAWVALSHAEAWPWLEQFPVQDVLNIDSHHDLGSLSGDPARLRPGNWAGLALQAGKIRHYTCQYPTWHQDLPVAEGYDLDRTREELTPLLTPELLAQVSLTRSQVWPARSEVRAILIVQSPAWTNPAHDLALQTVCQRLGTRALSRPLQRGEHGV